MEPVTSSPSLQGPILCGFGKSSLDSYTPFLLLAIVDIT